MNLEALLPYECDQLGVRIPRTTACHEKSENELLACRNFKKKGVLGLYYESLSYVSLEKQTQEMEKCAAKFV